MAVAGCGVSPSASTLSTCHLALLTAATISSAAAWFFTSMSSPFFLLSFASKIRRLARVQHGVDGPVFLRHERANLLLALHDQAQRNGLHAAGA